MVCLIPTTIGALLAAIGIAGMERALQANILAKSGKAVELAGDVDVVLLDKTGTITVGNRHATQFVPTSGYSVESLGDLAALSSIADPTPEGKSIVALHRKSLGDDCQTPIESTEGAEFISFTAQTRMSGINLKNGQQIRKGAPDAVIRYVKELGGRVPDGLQKQVDEVAMKGATPLLVGEGSQKSPA